MITKRLDVTIEGLLSVDSMALIYQLINQSVEEDFKPQVERLAALRIQAYKN
jgi:hypothetical protein